ncbi:MAG TPA: sugar ABC transporter permease [Candidatus Dormibacteraeota bacterium]|jgi:multiple sugar transport system permease protein|nr:sugar ABC transporter permease [Candidatus Dormibacteraeota bacterium]
MSISILRRRRNEIQARPGSGGWSRRFPLAYRLLIPIALFEGLFVLFPIIRGITMAFQFTRGGITYWVGLANFADMLHDPTFWGSIRVTFEFALCMIVIWLMFGVLLALLMNWSFKGRGLVRALLAIPWAIPDVPIVLTFVIMLDPNVGVINLFASWIPGVHHQIPWLSSPKLAFFAIVIMAGWKGLPFYALILLASLQSIPSELYEAARVDGAKAWGRFRAVTVPGLTPTAALLVILAFIFAIQQFSMIYLTTGGGPGFDTATISVLIYLQAFEFFNYNYAAALAVAGLVMSVAGTTLFVVLDRTVLRRQYFEGRTA